MKYIYAKTDTLMIIVILACTLQVLLVWERLIHLLLQSVIPSKASAVKVFSGRLVLASVVDVFVMLCSLPFQLAVSVVSTLLSNAVIGISVLMLVGGLALMSQNSSPFMAYALNVYNSGLGITLNKFFVTPWLYIEMLLIDAIPVYNAVVWFIGRILLQLLDVLQQSVDIFPDLASNVSLFFTTLGQSTVASISKLQRCWAYDAANPDLDCIGNTLSTSLDVMSPAVYVQGAFGNVLQALHNVCLPALLPLNVVLYPLVDVNIYLALHSLVNCIWSFVCGTWVQRGQRCAYGAATGFASGDAAVMCMPDFNTAVDWLNAFIVALGQLIDNWLNMMLVFVERAWRSDANEVCLREPTMRASWDFADTYLSPDMPRRVVGLTPALYAVTDGISTVYRSRVQGGRDIVADSNWPFLVNPRYGIAAVKHSQLLDPDYDGAERTGLLGCQCFDVDSGGIEVLCASVPFLDNVDDEAEAYNTSAIHRVTFPSPLMTRYMRCDSTRIKVTSLRFSRKRAAIGRSDGFDSSFRDTFDSLNQFGDKVATYTADAAIYISPLCSLEEADSACLPDAVSCFPFCMGLHLSGQSGQNISAYNARRWRESVQVQQLDCVTESLVQVEDCRGQYAEAYSEAFGFSYQAACEVDRSECVSSDLVHTSVPLSDTAVTTIDAPVPTIRLERQPFVMAGDIVLYVQAAGEGETEDSLVVTRLYDNNRGDYSLQNELLLHLDAQQTLPVKTCPNAGDEACAREVVSRNGITKPAPDRLEPLQSHAVAVSEWGVHWADTPDNSVFAADIQWCSVGTAGTTVVVPTSYGLPRIWTVRATRMAMQGLRNVLPQTQTGNDDALTAYWTVPDWLGGTIDCDQVVNLKIVDLEYLNAENILVTVLRAAVRDYDVSTGRVKEGKPYTYSFYFMHPNQHRCLPTVQDATSSPVFTCWRTQAEGMFPSRNLPKLTTASVGLLCPALQRMPQLGALGAHVLLAQTEAFRRVLDLALVVPVALAYKADVYALRTNEITFHPVLDNSGTSLFDFDSMLNHLDMAAFHLTNSMVRIFAFFEGMPGYNRLQPIVVGTAKIFQFAGDSLLLQGPLLSLFGGLKRMPALEGVESVAGGLEAAPVGGPAKESKIISSVKSSVKSLTTSFRYIMRVVKPLAGGMLKMFRKGRKANLISFIPSLLAETEGDFKRSFTNNMRLQCDGLATVLGTTNPIATSIRHACLMLPNSFDSTMQVLIILTVDYPAMACACIKTQERNPASLIEEECFQSRWGTRNRVNMQEIRRSSVLDAEARDNLCFAVMDTVNDRLERAFDPVFSRMYKFTREMGRAVDYVFAFFLRPDAGVCDNFLSSPYTISIVPYPIEYFAGCVHTFDCRLRCQDELQAFELALSQVTASDGGAPRFSTTQDVQVESRYYSEDDVLNRRHLPPFEVFAVLDLPAEHCAQICNSANPNHRCSAVAGRSTDALGVPTLGTAYYCISADFDTAIFQSSSDTSRPLPEGDIEDMFFATSDQHLDGKLEAVVVLTRSAQGSRLVVVSTGGQMVTLMRTQGAQAVPTSFRIQDFAVLEDVWVLPSSDARDTAVLYASGTYEIADTGQTIPACVHMELRLHNGELLEALPAIRSCNFEPDEIFSSDHLILCINKECTQVVFVPRSRSVLKPVEVASFDHTSDVISDRTSYATASGNSASVGAIVNLDKRQLLFRTQEGRAGAARRRVSPWAVDRWRALQPQFGKPSASTAAGISFDFLVVLPNADPTSFASWLVNVQMQLREGLPFQAKQRASMMRTEKLDVGIECSVDNCIGCRAQNSARPDLQDLEAKCFVAQQCSVARCAGTLVNMRKPLCNVGKVLAAPMDLFRVASVSVWKAVAYNVISIVELSQARRQVYENVWVDEVFAALMCNLKDLTTEMVAFFTSIIGSIDYAREKLHRDGVFMRGYQVDPRYHARLVMTITAMTRAIAAFFHAPQFAATALLHSVRCGVNDTVIVLQDILDPNNANPRIEMGSRRLAEARSKIAGICLSQSMQSVIQEVDQEVGGPASLTGRVTDAMTQINELVARSAFAPIAHSIDGIISYLLGILDGLRDTIQTIDWYHCKPPLAGVPDVSACVCGDTPFRIPAARKTGTTQTLDFWCSGPLIFDSAFDDPILVWNPYSLHDLLQVQGLEEYVQCLSSASECEPPRSWADGNQVLQTQGVEVLQIVTRCRSNFQQKQWDDGALLLGTFDRNDWKFASLDSSEGTVSGFEELRAQLVRKSQSASLRSHMRVDLPEDVWQCLHNAAAVAQFNHACLELHALSEVNLQMLEQYFMYEPAPVVSFQESDACQTFTGLASSTSSRNNASHTLTVWSPSSRNSVPVASYHFAQVDSSEERIAHAQTRLQQLLDRDILPELEQQATQPLNLDKIETEAWSVEGDHLHQLIDCVLMGPYAAADLHASFTMSDGQAFPVPQYHRGDPKSRTLPVGPGTGGSEARRQIIAAANDILDAAAKETVVAEAARVAINIRNQFKDILNLQCLCPSGSTARASVECCTRFSDIDDIAFQTRNILQQADTSWNLVSTVVSSIFTEIIDSHVLTRDVWASTRFTGPTAREFTEEERLELRNAYAFDFTRPVREYSTAEVELHMRQKTLWHQCTSLLSASFFSMPLKEGEDSVHGSMEYDATAGPTPGSSEGSRYVHAIERAVEKLLERAQHDSPHIWTHVHRYVPSDSVWCESDSLSSPSARVPTHLPDFSVTWEAMGDYVGFRHSDIVQIEKVSELTYSGSINCLCGWVTSGNPVQCASHPDSIVCADWDADDVEWQTVCTSGVISSKNDFFTLLRIMEEGAYEGWMEHCVESVPGVHWGLMDVSDVADWLDGAQPTVKFGMLHELASEGPGGLRIGLLGARINGNTLYEYVRKQRVLRRASAADSQANFAWKHTIAQPYCDKDIPTLLTSLGNDLTQHFPDVFFPMAHSIHDAPASAYCARYTIESAILRVLQLVHDEQVASGTHASGLEPVLPLLVAQRDVVPRWRLRCLTQVQQIGLCELRGVYDLRPPDDEYAPPTDCGFSLASDHGCEVVYITSSCLIYCRAVGDLRGYFYDPCSATGVDCGASTISFTYAGFSGQAVDPDIRDFVLEDSVRLLSMHWPERIGLDEASADPEQQRTLDNALRDLPKGLDTVDVPALLQVMLAPVKQILESGNAAGEGVEAPSAYCDDLFDYWSEDTQHPVGYHPSTSSTLSHTRVRGFASWMSAAADDSTAWRVDPRRLRDYEMFSHAYGAAHLTCDRSVYGKEGVPLNPFYLESKWNPSRTSDPAVPQPVAADIEADMTHLGENPQAESYAATRDTALRNSQHSTGLVHQWPRAGSETVQAEIDAAWPATLSVEYGLSSADVERTASCAFPGIRVCSSDADCASTAGGMRCLLNTPDDFGREFGLCAWSDTCYMHRHCPDDLLCSGTGRCVAPILYLHNDIIGQDVTASLYSQKDVCASDSWGTSHYQNVPSMARDHGLCRFRDWENYQRVTEAYDVAPIFNVQDAAHEASDDPTRTATTLRSRQFMHVDAHACDRTYEHTGFGRCIDEVTALLGYEGMAEPAVAEVTQTWRRGQTADATVSTPLCYMPGHRESRPVAGFLFPYEHVQDGLTTDTLYETPREVGFCQDFDVCLEAPFSLQSYHSHAEAPQLKRMVLQLASSASTDGSYKFPGSVRTYTEIDARLCWGHAYQIQIGDRELCVADRYTNPLLTVLFSDIQDHVPVLLNRYDGIERSRSIRLAQYFNELRSHCPKAFGAADEPAVSLGNFEEYFYATTVAVLPEDSSQVGQRLNQIIFEIMGPERGFDSVDEYLQKSRCMQHLYASLLRVQGLAQRDNERPYTYIDSNEPPAPGLSLYLFHERAAVQMTLEWMWKCVFVARSPAERGAPANWFSLVTTAGLSDSLQCLNYDEDFLPNQRVSLRTKLQRDTHLFDVVDPGEERVVQNFGVQIRQATLVALDTLKVSAWQDLFCVARRTGKTSSSAADDPENLCHFPMMSAGAAQNSPLPGQPNPCWEHYGRDRQEGLEDVVDGGLFEDVRNVVLNNQDLTSQVQDLKTLIDLGVVKENYGLRSTEQGRLDEENAVMSHAAFLPSLRFPHLDAKLLEYEDAAKLPRPVELQSASLTTSTLVRTTGDAYATLDTTQQCAPYADMKQSSSTSYVLSANHRQYSVQTTTVPGFVTLPASARLFVGPQGQTSFTKDQLLYLVLHIFQSEIFNSAVFRVGNLHQTLNLQNSWKLQLQSQLEQARTFNRDIARRTNPCTHTLTQAETNRHSVALRTCLPAFQTQSGWSLSARQTMRFSVSARLLLAGFYLTIASTDQAKFLTTLFSARTAESSPDAVCGKRDQSMTMLSPYWASDFLFDMGCDSKRLPGSTARVIDAKCFTPEGRTCADAFPLYADVVFGRGDGSPRRMQEHCAERSGNLVDGLPLKDPLCERMPPQPELCNSVHHTFGQFKGQQAESLYATYEEPAMHAGVWASQSTLFQGERTYSAPELTGMQVLPSDIGGHYLGFVADAETVFLECAHLSHRTPTERCRMPVRDWMLGPPKLSELWAYNHELQRQQWPEPDLPASDWKCPMRWQDAYDPSTLADSFASLVPNKARNQKRFMHITGASPYAHPTVMSTARIRGLQPPLFISDTHQCIDPASPACRGTVLLAAVVQAMRLSPTAGEDFTPWHLVTRVGAPADGSAQCPHLIDWPNGTYTLSDRDIVQGDLLSGDAACSVADRLPEAMIRMKMRSTARGEPSTTLLPANSPGGVCHMAHLPRITDSITSVLARRCRIEQTDSREELVCEGFDAVAKSVREQAWPFERPGRAPLPVGALRRRRCSNCESMTAQTIVDAYGKIRSADATAPRHLSVGLPRRFASLRLLSQHVRRSACPPTGTAQIDGVCAELSTAIPSASWTLDAFATPFLALASQAGDPASAYDDTDLWARPWVFCQQGEVSDELQRCSGSMTRTEWIDPTQRTQKCYDKIVQKLSGVSAPVQFCKLTDATSKLCQKVQSWNAQILRILCESTGLPQCPRFGFFYTPAAYSVDNQAFVADTVQDFYDRVTPGTCPAHTIDTTANDELLIQCSSRNFAFLQTILELARNAIFNLIEIMYYAVMFAMHLGRALLILIAGAVESAQGNVDFLQREGYKILVYMMLMLQKMAEFFLLFMDVTAKLIFEDGIFKALLQLIENVCEMINDLIYFVVKIIWCSILDIAAAFHQVFTGDYEYAQRMREGATTAGIAECSDDFDGRPIECDMTSDYRWDPVNVVLPVASRCWSTYTTFFGDQGPLSCTHGDTCLISPLSDQRIKCALCPQTSDTVLQFGCDAATKQCVCGVPIMRETRCVSNIECQDATANCKYIDGDLDLSGGSVRCQVCSSPSVCFMPKGATSGTCACPLLNLPFSQCRADDYGKNIYPKQFNSLCLLNHDSTAAQNSEREADVEELITVPCESLNPVGTYCTRISQNLAVAGYYIVGFGTLPTFGRRLLGVVSESNFTLSNSSGSRESHDPGALHSAVMSFAHKVPTRSSVCRDALAAWAWAVEHDRHFELSETAVACAEAANRSAVTSGILLHQYNVSLPPCTFCSLSDVMEAFGSMYSLPLSAWILIMRRHEAIPRNLPFNLSNSLPTKRMLQVLRHDVAGHVILALEHVLPDASTSTSATVRRFFVQTRPPESGPPHRRVLSVTGVVEYFDSLQASIFDDSLTESYSQLVSTSWQSNLPPLSPEQLAAWQLLWPPQFVSDADGSCSFASRWLSLAQQAAESVPAAKDAAVQRARDCTPNARVDGANCRPKSNLSDAWPKLLDSSEQFSAAARDSTASFLTGVVVDAAFSLLAAVGIDSKILRDVIYSVLETAQRQFRCDLDAVQTCSQWRVNAWMGTVVVAVMYGVLFAICNSLSASLVAVALVPFFPFFVWHVCYGYQLFCAPTIPACFVADIRATMQSLLPPQMEFPLLLLRDTASCQAERFVVPSECILPCSDAPLAYTSWYAVMAWWAVETGAQQVVSDVAALLPRDLLDLNELEFQIEMKRGDIVTGGDLANANRLCAILESYRLLPYIFVLGVAAVMLLFLTRFAVTLFFSIVMFVTKLFVYSITDNADT